MSEVLSTETFRGASGAVRSGRIGPALVCWGEEDGWIPLAKGRQLAGLIPGARFEPIAGAGHLVQEDAPAEPTAVLLDFLQDQQYDQQSD